MKRLYLVCGFALLGLVALTAYYRSEPDTFYGIADARETVISAETPVEIRGIRVQQGQIVEQGDTLVEVHSPELELRYSQISHELKELRTRMSTHNTLTKSELLQLKAQQEERVSEIRAEIAELEAQYEMNRELVSELRSLDREKAAAAVPASQNPVLAKLESLRRLLKLAQDPTRVYETRLASAMSSDGDPLAEQVRRLEDELRILEGDRRRQIITAQISGVIGSINFKVGEKVSSFLPIVTLHAAAPSFVRGYIHEDVYSQVSMGQKVKVRGIQNHADPVNGLIVGVGTRIVEYPERLRKRADILIWGREVIVQLPANNRFLLGEKVVITLPRSNGDSREEPAVPIQGTALAGPNTAAPGGAGSPNLSTTPSASPSTGSLANSSEMAPAGNSLPDQAASLPGIEASGLLWLEDVGKLVLVSDDTPKKQPLLFLADTTFAALKPAAIAGLDKMDDMEAVAPGPRGSLYVLSSQSRNKNGKLADPRKLLVKARRQAEAFSLEGKVLLLDALAKAAEAAPQADWAAFLSRGIAAGTVDIEGLAARGDTLFLGFKAPLLDGKAVILRIAGGDALFTGAVPDKDRISLWKSLDLRGGSGPGKGTACGIADLAFVGDDVYLISTGTAGAGDPNQGEGPHVGELWRLPAGADRAERLRDFAGAKPEGLAWHAPSRTFFVAFDNGSKEPSRVLRVEGPR